MRRFLLALLLLTACAAEQPATTATTEPPPATPPPPSAEEARTMIETSPDFGEHQFTNAAFSIPVAGAAMNEPSRAAARDLAEAGWLAFDGAGDIMLTEKSRNDRRFLLRPNGILDVVPLAKKEMGRVLGVRSNPDGTASADFNWRWLPNEVGQAFRGGPIQARFAETNTSRATFIWDGTSWSVLKIDQQ